MLVHAGAYRWFSKRLAYRSGYCLTCGRPTLSFQYRAFYVVHVLLVPLVPLGVWRTWHCADCGSDPHASPRARKGLRWAGTAAVAIFAAAVWSALEGPRDNMSVLWSLRLLSLIALAAAIAATVRSPPDQDLAELLRTIEPIVDAICPVCEVMLYPSEPWWRCPRCGMVRLKLAAG